MMTKHSPMPWQHQIDGARFALSRPAAMLAMGMGTGKTRTAIDVIQSRASAGKVRRTLIVCPKAVVSHWPSQADEWAVRSLPVKFVGAETAKTGNYASVNVINYERYWREPYKTWIKRGVFDLAVLDEAHRIKSPGAKAARFAHWLAGTVPFRLALTGTPLHDTPLDAYSQYKFLDPGLFGTRFSAFKARYVEYDEYGPWVPGVGPVKIKGYKNLDEFRRKLDTITFWAGSEILDLPPLTFQTRYADLPPKARKVYRNMYRDFIAHFAGDSGYILADNVLVRLLRLQQIATGTVQSESTAYRLHDAKENLLADTLADIPQDEAVVVFGVFRSDLNAINRAARRAGRQYYEQSGAADGWRDFQRSRARGPLIGVQMKSGSAGVCLTRANHAVFYTTGFSRGDYEQAIRRVHRPGQRRHVSVIHLIMRDTVDQGAMEAIKGKGDVIDWIKEKYAA